MQVLVRDDHARMWKALPLLLVLGCGNSGDNTGQPDSGPDVTTAVDAGAEAQVEAEASIPTGATLAVGPSFVWVRQGGQAQVPFTVTRNGVPGALTVHATGLPSGVTASDTTVPDGQSNGTLALAAASSAVLGATSQATLQLLDQTQTEDQKTLTVGVSGAPGALDTTWAGGGAASLQLPYNALGYAIAVYPASAGANAGKIVLAGNVQVSYPTDARIVIARYDLDGSLDPTFGDPAASDGGTSRLGYTLFNPGLSDETAITTWPPAVRIDSKGRIVVVNNRSPAGSGSQCYTELGRWTADGVVDSTFTRYSGNLNGGYCGISVDVAVTSADDPVVLAEWNIATGAETVIAPFSGADGTRQGSGVHVRLDPSGTAGSQKTTEPTAFRIDASGAYLVTGRQCDGGWSAGLSACLPFVDRVLAAGQLDTGFATKGYTTFSFGTGGSQRFLGETIDPTTSDVVAVGTNDLGTLGTMARVSGTTGAPATFGTQGSLTRNLYTGATSESLWSVMVDSQSRIVAAGSVASGTQGYLARTRCMGDGKVDTTYAGSGSGVTAGAGEAAALGNDDRLYVVGASGTTLTIWRYWP